MSKPISVVWIEKQGSKAQITIIQGKRQGKHNSDVISCDLWMLERFMCFVMADLPEALQHLAQFLNSLKRDTYDSALGVLCWAMRILDAWPWNQDGKPELKWRGFSKKERHYYIASIMMAENAPAPLEK